MAGAEESGNRFTLLADSSNRVRLSGRRLEHPDTPAVNATKIHDTDLLALGPARHREKTLTQIPNAS